MLSVGELPAVVGILREWRKDNYKKDPVTEQLYGDEFAKNKLVDCQIHPTILNYLRDEGGWQRDQNELSRLLAQRPQTSYATRPSPSASPLVTRAHSARSSSSEAAPPPSGNAAPHMESTTTSATTASNTVSEAKEEMEQEHEEELSDEEEPAIIKDNKDETKDHEVEERRKSVFQREDVVTSRSQSALTVTLAARRTRETLMDLMIYLCCSTGASAASKLPPMRIRVPEAATVDRVLDAVRKKSAEDAIPLNLDPLAYCLRIAEDDGTPDSDAPQLHSEAEVKRFGRTFCIVDNPAYKSASITSHRLIKVAMGDDQFQTIEVKDKDMKVKDILWRVCTKSLMDYTQHGLRMVTSEDPLPLDMSVADIQATNLVLVKKSKNRSTLRSSARPKNRLGVSSRKQRPALFRSLSNNFEKRDMSDDESDEEMPLDPSQAKLTYAFWSDTVAFRHKRYEVTRMSKFGMKQERYIGIDRDRITNTSKKKGADLEGNIQAWKEIKNVVDAVVSETKPSQFTLIFKEDGKENESHTFEALTAQEACEIVEKIKYCKNNTLHT